MILALFFLLAQNVLAVDEVTNCSICLVKCPLESVSGVAVTLCAGRHEFCADCLQTWIKTQKGLNHVATCPLCNEELPNAINQPIIQTTCRFARRNFWKEKSKKAFEKFLHWELKRLTSQLYNFWVSNLVVVYFILLSFVLQSPGDLLEVSSITLLVPTITYLLPVVVLLPAVPRVWNVHCEIAAEGYRNRVRRVVSENFFWAWNHVRDYLHDNRHSLIAVTLLWLVWVYQHFVYMGGTYTTDFAFVALVAPLINFLCIVFEFYLQLHINLQLHFEGGNMAYNFYMYHPHWFKYNFAMFGAMLYGMNEIAYRIIAPTGFFPVILWYIRWGMWILFKLLFTLGKILVPFIVYHPIYSIYVLYVFFLVKTLFSRNNN